MRGQGQWGAYNSEKKEFNWARELSPAGSKKQSPEAQIMDWADDVTYSVHDVEDFYKAGLIPLERLNSTPRERQSFCEEVFRRNRGSLPATQKELTETFERLAGFWAISGPYTGDFLERQTLKMIASQLIGDFVRSIRVDLGRNSCEVKIDSVKQREVFMLKQLTWHYVILNPALTTQQRGQRLVIEGLFSIYLEAVKANDFCIFPTMYREKLDSQVEHGATRPELIRTVIDMIASMTESQAIHIYHRLNGTALGSALHYPAG